MNCVNNRFVCWIVSLGAILLFLSCGGTTNQFTSEDSGAVVRDVITKANYDQIQTGMSYHDVVKIIGTAGEEMSSNRIEGVPGVMKSTETIMYMWKNSDGTNMNVIFQNDKLFQKSQFGLR